MKSIQRVKAVGMSLALGICSAGATAETRYEISGFIDEASILLLEDIEQFGGATFSGVMSYDSTRAPFLTDPTSAAYDGASLQLTLTDNFGGTFSITIENGTSAAIDDFDGVDYQTLNSEPPAGYGIPTITTTTLPGYATDPTLGVSVTLIDYDSVVFMEGELYPNIDPDLWDVRSYTIRTLVPGTNQVSRSMSGTITSMTLISPPPDADGDGVADADDNCPLAPNPEQIDEDGDGIGRGCVPVPADAFCAGGVSTEASSKDRLRVLNRSVLTGDALARAGIRVARRAILTGTATEFNQSAAFAPIDVPADAEALGPVSVTGGTLTLGAGSYVADAMTLGAGGQLAVDAQSNAPVIVYIPSGAISFAADAALNAGGDPGALVLVVGGGQPVQLVGSSSLTGKLYATNSVVNLRENASVTGNVVARRLFLRDRSQLAEERTHCNE